MKTSSFEGGCLCAHIRFRAVGAIDDDPVIALLLGSFDSAGRKELAAVSHSYVSARPRWWHVHSDGEVQR